VKIVPSVWGTGVDRALPEAEVYCQEEGWPVMPSSLKVGNQAAACADILGPGGSPIRSDGLYVAVRVRSKYVGHSGCRAALIDKNRQRCVFSFSFYSATEIALNRKKIGTQT
jgi:hypothetical protein